MGLNSTTFASYQRMHVVGNGNGKGKVHLFLSSTLIDVWRERRLRGRKRGVDDR